MRDGVLVITLEDRGQAFDPRTMQMPEAEDLAKPLEERTMSSWGSFSPLKEWTGSTTAGRATAISTSSRSGRP